MPAPLTEKRGQAQDIVRRIMVWPQLVPIRMAIKLLRAGIPKPSLVHEHIRNGTLRSLRGIGRKWEVRIIDLYSLTPRQLTKGILTGTVAFVEEVDSFPQ